MFKPHIHLDNHASTLVRTITMTGHVHGPVRPGFYTALVLSADDRLYKQSPCRFHAHHFAAAVDLGAPVPAATRYEVRVVHSLAQLPERLTEPELDEMELLESNVVAVDRF